MKKNKAFRNNRKLMIILVYTILAVLLVTGCRPSDNIVQTVYDQNADKTDHNHQIVVTTTDKSKDNDLKEQQKDQEADRDTDTENMPDNSEKTKTIKLPMQTKRAAVKSPAGAILQVPEKMRTTTAITAEAEMHRQPKIPIQDSIMMQEEILLNFPRKLSR